MIMKYLLLILLTFFSIKTEAQNVFFGDTLRFDSSTICKLLNDNPQYPQMYYLCN